MQVQILPATMISTKREMYRLFLKGALGNRLRTWDNVHDYLDSGFGGRVVLRSKQMAGICNYDISRSEACRLLLNMPEGTYAINESASDQRLIFQGEVRRSEHVLDLVISEVKAKMRDALLKRSIHLFGLTAVNLLKATLRPSSYDDLMDLLEICEVVEFGIYDMLLGDCRGRNTIIWECRNY